MPPPVPVCLADRYAGVRTALREVLEAAGAARVLGEAGTLAEARAACRLLPAEGMLISGLRFPDGPVTGLLGGSCRVVVCTWLPPDERELDLAGAAAVVGPPLVAGLLDVLRGRFLPYHPGQAPR